MDVCLNGYFIQYFHQKSCFCVCKHISCDVHKCIRICHLIAKEHFRMGKMKQKIKKKHTGLDSEWPLWQSSDCVYLCVCMFLCLRVCFYGESVSFCALSLLSQHFLEANIDEVPCHLFVTPYGVDTQKIYDHRNYFKF